MDKHARLNTCIDQKFAAGWENMTIVNAQIHSQGQTPDSVKALSLEEKRDWLGSVTAGRKGLRVPTHNNCAHADRLMSCSPRHFPWNCPRSPIPVSTAILGPDVSSQGPVTITLLPPAALVLAQAAPNAALQAPAVARDPVLPAAHPLAPAEPIAAAWAPVDAPVPLAALSSAMDNPIDAAQAPINACPPVAPVVLLT